jgi:hypothetical protein
MSILRVKHFLREALWKPHRGLRQTSTPQAVAFSIAYYLPVLICAALNPQLRTLLFLGEGAALSLGVFCALVLVRKR